MEDRATSSADANKDVFGSPPEPVFNDSRRGISPELLQQSLKSLTGHNSASLAQHSHETPKTDCFRSDNAVSYIFSLCRYWGLGPDVRYRAVELFHRFMTKHIIELYLHVKKTQENDSPLNWDVVEGRLKHQVPLRALTCVQLASKLSLHYKIVGIAKASSFMSRCGFRYAATSLVQSEIRVLKTLQFQVHGPTPLDYVELITEIVGETKIIPVKQLHGVSLKVLDIFYHNRKDVFQTMKTRDMKLTNIGSDFMLLAASVVGAAAFILSQTNSDYVISIITSAIPSLDKDSILDMSAVLVEQIMLKK